MRERIWTVGLTISKPRVDQYAQQVFLPSFFVFPPWLGFINRDGGNRLNGYLWFFI